MRNALQARCLQVERWETVNEQHARTCLNAAESGTEIPRRVQRRFPDAQRQYRRRKDHL